MKNTKSRRRFLIGIAAGLSGLTAANIFYKRRKKQSGLKQPGQSLVLPDFSRFQNVSIILGIDIRSDNKNMALSCGNLTEKYLFAAPYPPRKPSDYTLIAEFKNCYKVDGIRWSLSDTDQLSCKITSIDSHTTLPPIFSKEEWRDVPKKFKISEKDISGGLYTISNTNKSCDCICPLPPSLKETNTALTLQADNNVIFCFEKETGLLTLCSAEEKKILKEIDFRKDFPNNRIQGMTWNESQNECQLLTIQNTNFEFIRVSSNGDVLGSKNIAVDTKGKTLSFIQMNSKGNMLIGIDVNQPRQFFLCNFVTEEMINVPIEEGYGMAIPAVLDNDGNAIVLFSDSKGEAIPPLADRQFQIIQMI